jgi:hypothetical protein
MIKDFQRGEYVTNISYELAFDDGHNNGFGFPCDKDGNFIITENTNPAAIENYHWCLEHPEKFVRWNKVVEWKHSYRENNSGVCNCGNRIELYNEYLGACECPNCGQWWNTSGQMLNPVETWSDGDDWDDSLDAELW